MTGNSTTIGKQGESSDVLKPFLTFLKNYVNGWITAAAVLPTAITYPLDRIHQGGLLIFLYILIMVFAECAFFFMAFREFHSQTAN